MFLFEFCLSPIVCNTEAAQHDGVAPCSTRDEVGLKNKFEN